MRYFRKNGNKKIIMMSVLLLAVGIGAFFLFSNLKKASAEWFDQKWYFRKAIEIPSHTASENNVYVTVPTFDATDTSRFQPDCGDLRFTKQDGQLLSYYVVDCDATANIHVQFDTLPAGASTYYMYYGNPSAPNDFESADFATAASGLGSQTLAAEEKGPAPVAYWKFDEGQGQTAYDQSSNSNDGTLGSSSGSDSADPSWQTEDLCVTEKCLKFDGSTDYIDVGNVAKLDITSAITIEAWIKPYSLASSGDYRIVQRFGDSANKGYYLRLVNDNKVGYGSFGNDEYYTYSGSIVGKWTHLVVVFADSTTRYLYINGALVQTATGSNKLPLTYTGGMYIGSDVGSTGFFNGFIDEVKIYPYARSVDQIKAEYNAGKSGGGGRASAAVFGAKAQEWMSNGLVGYWKMDEATWSGTLDEVVDSSGNENHGTAGGATDAKAYPAGGKFGNGGYFDGVDDYIGITHSQGNNIKTVSVWFKLDSMPTGIPGGIVLANASSTSGPTSWDKLIRVTTAGKIQYYFYDGGGPNVTGTTTLTTDVWYHAVGVTYGDYTAVYLNGVLEGTYNSVSTYSGSSMIIDFDDTAYSSTQDINGHIDEVRIYNRALSPKEVSDLYNWAPGPVGHWKMDDGVSGNSQTVIDSSGYGNNGTTYYGANITGMNCKIIGKYGSGCAFDGIDDYIDAGNDSSLSPSLSGITVEAWVYRTATLTGGYRWDIVGKSTWCNGSYSLGIDAPSNNTEMYVTLDGSCESLSGGVFPSNQWVHYAMTAEPGGKYISYINGVIDAEDTLGAGVLNDNSNTLKINGYSIGEDVSPANLQGKIDDVRIYNYARTQKQIMEDMNAGSPLGGNALNGYAAYWKFDEGHDSLVNDRSINNNDGTVSGATWTNDGKFSKALSFDGTDDYVTVADSPSLDFGTESVSISHWVFLRSYPPSSESWGRGTFTKRAGEYYFNSRINNGQPTSGTLGTIGVEIKDGTDYAWAVTTSPIGLNAWHHLVLVINKSVNKMMWYKDGYLASTEADISSIGDFGNNASFDIGKAVDGTIDGYIDEMKIFPFALTADEVKTEYNQGKSIVLGSVSDTALLSGGSVASNSASAAYCIPGDTTSCAPPVGEWKFDENVAGDSQTLYDTSGNGNNGTSNDGANNTGMNCKVLGKKATGCKFDGTDDYVDVGAAKFDTLSDVTVELWFNRGDTASNNRVMFSHLKDSVNRQLFWIGDSDKKIHAENIVGGSNRNISSDNATVANTWYHVAVLFGSTGLKMYVNGSLQASTNATTDSFDAISVTTANIIGSQYGSDYNFPGIIDDVKIFNYARTPAQVAWDYNRGKPVGHWKFDECQGITVRDSSGNGNTGTISIGATVPQSTAGTCVTPSDGTGAWYNGRSGKFNSAMSFDGVDDYINAGNGANLQITDAITISTWVKLSNAADMGNGDFGVVVGKAGGSPANGYNLTFQDSTDQLLLELYNGGTWHGVSSTKTDWQSDVWYHIVATFQSQTSGSNNKKIYVNGVLDNSSTENDFAIGSSSQDLGVGSSTSGVYNFNGLVDDVKVYNYALTPAQIKLDYNQGSAVRFGPNAGRP